MKKKLIAGMVILGGVVGIFGWRGENVMAVRGVDGGMVAIQEEDRVLVAENTEVKERLLAVEGDKAENKTEGEASTPVSNNDGCKGAQVSILGDGCIEDDGQGGGVFFVLNIILVVMTFGVGILGTLGIVVAGIQYMTARDNEATVMKAKTRILEIVIGLAIYAVMFTLLQFLIPGGII